LKLLAQKVKEGVEIRALFDAFGNMSNDSPLRRKDLKAIRATGIQIEKFDPVIFPWLNHLFARDHRKIVVIDGKKGYIGGVNVADYYIDGIEGVGEWRDMHARVEGNAVNDMQRIFLDMWNSETKQNIGGCCYFPEHGKMGDASIAVVDRRPHVTPERIRRAYANAIHSAKDSIILVNPYFLPMPLLRRALEKAIDDGVKVKIILSEKSDIKMIPEGVWRAGYQFMKRGAEVYMFTGGFNHAKAMCIDGNFCTIGSANFNSRSLRYDYEANIFIFNKEETAKLYRMLQEDMKKSYLLTEEIYKKRGWWKRFCGWLVSIITPLT
jgi:cardiolipin synthase